MLFSDKINILMKKLLLSLVILIIFGKTQMLNAQNKKFDFSSLRPVVQVFGTTYFNIENNNFNYGIGRAHLGFKYEFNNKWSAKIILDRGRPTRINNIVVTDTTGNVLPINIDVTEGAYYTMFLKFASLQWKVNSKLRLQAGAILENHYITQEKFWGLRYVSQTFQDLYWHLPSSDLGFITYYKIITFNSIGTTFLNMACAGQYLLADSSTALSTASLEISFPLIIYSIANFWVFII